ncbi:ribosomal protein uS17 [Lewinella aquimaris]|uniref:Small ribosomal subunit protein uS17 n=1 Tax=Neolewinella aquimaris TaxID=1835722 RepID=A0A840E7X2_9BACT|nr:ribosomal protein uS17 [Neolewinella aquimaris]
MSNEEKNTPEQEQTQEDQGGLLNKITHAVDEAIDTAASAVESVTGSGEDAKEASPSTVDTAPASAPKKQAAAKPSASKGDEETATKSGRNERKTRDGVVVSNKMDKTISVAIERRLQHPIYGKYVKKTKKLIAHDESNVCQIGDLVRIMECRPLSRRKRWRLISVLEQAK